MIASRGQSVDEEQEAGSAAELAAENAGLRASLGRLQERVEELERLADTDTLTPLPNRRRFVRELERVVALADRHGTPAALLYIDVDSLKAINDDHGHGVGDAALVHVAGLLAGLVRSSDLAARIGGDEFALILDHLDHNSAIEAAERIARVIAQSPLEVEGRVVPLEASIGTAMILPGDSAEDAMKRADRNMYLAKSESAGR
jgi:diguanylate cyclase (GGDEF)-like protein